MLPEVIPSLAAPGLNAAFFFALRLFMLSFLISFPVLHTLDDPLAQLEEALHFPCTVLNPYALAPGLRDPTMPCLNPGGAFMSLGDGR